jgi:K+-sensing histidine kinase KdpD
MTSTAQSRRWRPDDRLQAVGLAIAGLGPLLVAGVFVPLREHTEVSSNMALVFVIIVVAAAAEGGRVAGAAAAIVSTMFYDFFFTRPFESLKIDRAEDIITTVLLLVIGLVVAELMGLAQRSRVRAEQQRDQEQRVRRVAALAAAGAPIDELVHTVERELAGLLGLQECRYEARGANEHLPLIARTGAIEGGRRRWVGTELSLPAEGAEIPVVGRGRPMGRIVLVPDWEVGVSIDERAIAVTLADQLGAALASEAPLGQTGT